MAEHLETVEFDYTRWGNLKDPWANYFHRKIQQLVAKARNIISFVNELRDRCHKVPYNELLRDHDYRHLLLGGRSEDGTYARYSLAKLYDQILGLRFKDPDEAINRLREGMTVDTPVVVEETEFTSFVADVFELRENVYRPVYESVQDWVGTSSVNLYMPSADQTISRQDFYDIVDEPDELLRLLSEFLDCLQSVLPNYDERALFLWTIDKTPKYYIEKAYPDTKDPSGRAGIGFDSTDELWEGFRDLFGLNEVLVPDIEPKSKQDEQRRRQYTIYSYYKRSVGQSLLDFYCSVWDAFDGELRDILGNAFQDIPNFKQDFLQEAKRSLDQIGWEIPDDIKYVETEEYGQSDIPTGRSYVISAEYEINGFTLSECNYTIFEWNSKTDDDYSRMTRTTEPGLLLSDFFDGLAPALFLLHGLEYRLDISENQNTVQLVEL